MINGKNWPAERAFLKKLASRLRKFPKAESEQVEELNKVIRLLLDRAVKIEGTVTPNE